MAAAVTQLSPVGPEVWGRRRVALVRIALSGTYSTGGEAFDPKTVGVPDPEIVLVQGTSASATAEVFKWDRVNKKIMAFELGGTGAAGDPLAEKTNAEAYVETSLSVVVIGK